MSKVAVLIPCYNESTTIEKVVRDFRAVLPEADIYVYDNNSVDGTAEIAQKAGAIVRYESQQGKGMVIRSMFRDIDADCYLMIDGDDTYPAQYAPELVDMVLNRGVDMAVGDRLSSTYFVENKRRFHNGGNVLVRNLVNTLFGGSIKDIMSGYRAFSYRFVKSYPVLTNGFEVETEMTIHALDKRMRVASIPVAYRDRPEGSVSKLNTTRDGIKVIKTIFKLCEGYKPLLFFGIISLVLAVVAIPMLISVVNEYFQTGLVPRFPTLIFSLLCLLAALQSAGFGIILDAISQKSKREFEIQLNMILSGERKRAAQKAININSDAGDSNKIAG